MPVIHVLRTTGEHALSISSLWRRTVQVKDWFLSQLFSTTTHSRWSEYGAWVILNCHPFIDHSPCCMRATQVLRGRIVYSMHISSYQYLFVTTVQQYLLSTDRTHPPFHWRQGRGPHISHFSSSRLSRSATESSDHGHGFSAMFETYPGPRRSLLRISGSIPGNNVMKESVRVRIVVHWSTRIYANRAVW